MTSSCDADDFDKRHGYKIFINLETTLEEMRNLIPITKK